MSTQNSRTNKLNLKNPNKNKALANLSIYCIWENIQSEYNNNKFLLQNGMISLIYLMKNIPSQSYKITFSTLLKNMRL